MNIELHKVVTIDFTMYGEGDEVLETSKDDSPLVYMHGVGELPDGLEEELDGKQAGDHVEITLQPEDAYGEYDEELIQSVPRDQFEDIEDISVGMRFEADTDEGPRVVKVVSLDEDEVVVDANEPYAGRTVRFDVTVLGVRDPSDEELEHEHVHGDDCDHDHE